MKKKLCFPIVLCLFFFASGLIFADPPAPCTGCSVSSDPTKNTGSCVECQQGGDVCITLSYVGPACSE